MENFNNQISIHLMDIGGLFSFRKKSAVHMIIRKEDNYIEYKSYNDGKIRVLSDLNQIRKIVFKRDDYDKQFDRKWFMPISDGEIQSGIIKIKYHE